MPKTSWDSMTSAAMHMFGKCILSCRATRLPEKNHTPRIFCCPSEIKHLCFQRHMPQVTVLKLEASLKLTYYTDANRTRTTYCWILSDLVGTIFCLLPLRDWTSFKFASLTKRPDFKMQGFLRMHTGNISFLFLRTVLKIDLEAVLI